MYYNIVCDLVIVCAVTNPDVPASRGISLLLVEDGMKGKLYFVLA
jgi:alkylation response protein AidB-like acyl-CoA dehydrogenase